MFRLVADTLALTEAQKRLKGVSQVAVDCEAAGFHRYSDRLCLVQVCTGSEVFLFDPLALDPAPVLAPLLGNPEVKVVMHGADYDLKLLERDLGVRVRGLFDTQVAALLLGKPAVGLAALVEAHLGVLLPKEHQRADWAQRPLPAHMLAYAARDTLHLLPLADRLEAELRAVDRWSWAQEEFRILEATRWESERSDPLTRIKGARDLEPRQATALRAALAWRDRLAREWDRAPFRVVQNAVLLAVVLERPGTPAALAAVPGFPPSLAKSHGEELLEILRGVDNLPPHALVPYPRSHPEGGGRPTPEEQALEERLREFRTVRAASLGLDRGVLLSNQLITRIARARPDNLEDLARVPGMRQWQVEVLGEGILAVLRESQPPGGS